MRGFVVAVLVAALAACASPAVAFSSSSSFSGASVTSSTTNSQTLTMEYIPSGMSKEQWKRLKDKEAKKKRSDLGKTGITTFKSRSFADWQKSGGKNLFPVDPRKVKDPKEIPYMQRPGGSADDSDLSKKAGFSFFGKKKEEKKAPEAEPKKTNWWTL